MTIWRPSTNEAPRSSGERETDAGRRNYTIDSGVVDVFPSSRVKNDPIPATERPSINGKKMNVSVVPYENHEILDTTPDRSSGSSVEDDKGVWVGIGCGEAFTLNTSACSESPLESHLDKYSNPHLHHECNSHISSTVACLKRVDQINFGQRVYLALELIVNQAHQSGDRAL